MDDKNEGRDAQVADALLDDGRVRGIDAHDLCGEKPGQESKGHRKKKRHPNRQAECLLYLVQVPCTPVLRGKDTAAADDAHAENGEEIVVLVCQTGSGYLYFSHLPEHHRVQHIHAHVDGMLQCDREHDAEDFLVK